MSVVVLIIIGLITFNVGLFLGMIYMETKWNIVFDEYHRKVIDLLLSFSDDDAIEQKEIDASKNLIDMWATKARNGKGKE